MNKKEYEENPKQCLQCKQPIPYEKRRNTYCNHSCRAKTTNLGTIRNWRNGNYSQEKKCLQCGSLIVGIDHPRKYCSRPCQDDHRVEEQIRFSLPIMGRTLAKYLIRRRGPRCEVCTNTMWNCKPITLEVHHIDGNPKNNVVENLQLVCPNCHSQTNNYKAKNRR